MRPVLPCAGTVNALGTSSQHRTWRKNRWGHVSVALLGSSQGHPWVLCPIDVTASGYRKVPFSPDDYQMTDDDGHREGPGTIPLHALSHLTPGQTKAETSGGEALRKEGDGLTPVSCWDGNGTMPSALGKSPGAQKARGHVTGSSVAPGTGAGAPGLSLANLWPS